MPDTALIARIAAHDRIAFAELYRRHAATILPLVTRITHSQAQARAILPRAFSGVWELAGGYGAAHTSPLRWIAAIVQEHTVLWLRAHGQSAVADEEAWRMRGEDELLNALSRSVPTGVNALLEADERRLVELAFFAGLSRSEIAAALNLTRRNVDGVLQRALLKLKAHNRARRGSTRSRERHKLPRSVARVPHVAAPQAQRKAA
jgi:RNA polymerase sigma-70 factor, ECF subfamily